MTTTPTAAASLSGLAGDIGMALKAAQQRWKAFRWRNAPPEVIPIETLPAEGSVIEIDGIRMKVDPRMSPFNIRKLARGRHTVHERALLTHHLRDGDRVIELGGGIGMVAIHCARRLGPGQVFSWEGNPDLESLIRENYALNAVEPELNMAVLGDRHGQVTFYLAPRFSHSGLDDNTGEARPVEVPMMPWSEAHARIGPTVLVCDIQGGEVAFFAHADLSGLRMILVEFHPPATGIRPILATRQKLRRAGFREVSRAGSSCVFLREI